MEKPLGEGSVNFPALIKGLKECGYDGAITIERSIYNCTMAEPEFKAPADCRYTQSVDGKRLYLHLFAYPFAHIALDGLAGKVDYAQFLHDGSEVKFTEGKVEHFSAEAIANEDQLILELPPVKPNSLVPVIEVFLK